jgi:hypothetical protein
MVLEEWLPKHLEANHNLTLEEHREAFEEEFGRKSPPPPSAEPWPACPMADGHS